VDVESKTERPADRRANDRRVKKAPFDGADKRAEQRRSARDRRTAPRA